MSFSLLNKILGFRNRVAQCPELRQSESEDGGFVALAMVMWYYRIIVTAAELNDGNQILRDGSNISILAETAHKYGFRTKEIRIAKTEDILGYSMPVILSWEFNRYLVCLGRKGECWVLNDPALGQRVLTTEEVEKGFTGTLLELTPERGIKRGMQNTSMFGNMAYLLEPCRTDVMFLMLIGFLMIPGNVVQPNMNSIIIDYFFNESYFHWGTPILCVGLFFLILTAGLMILQQVSLLSLNLRMTVINAYEILKKLFSLPTMFFQSHLSGDLVNRIGYIEQIAAFLSERFAQSVLNLLSIVFFAVILFHFDNVLGTLLTVLTGFLIFMLLELMERKKNIYVSMTQVDGKRRGVLVHGLSMIETIKASGMENEFFITWSDLFKSVRYDGMRLHYEQRWLYYLLLMFKNVCIALLVGLGAYRILLGSLSGGSYMAFQAIAPCLMQPVVQMIHMGTNLQRMFSLAKQLLDIRNYSGSQKVVSSVQQERPDCARAKMDGRISIRNLTFGYNKSLPPVVDHINLEIAAGERIAIVGLSGSGKSTIAKLLAGAYEPWSGEILLDGYSRKSYSVSELRYSFAIVDQEITLFPGTVYENLSMFDESLPFTQVRRAAEDALIHNAIIARHGGYSSVVNVSASNFSGGERQRLEIARALSVNPSVLILDEATAALDPSTEVKIDRNLRKRGITMIVIAHRLSTIRDADRIIVLDHGKIAEQGSHQELMKKNGIYVRLVNML